jgi:ribosomal protein L17
MKKLQIYFTEKELEFLEQESLDTGLPKAEILRRSLDKTISEKKCKK